MKTNSTELIGKRLSFYKLFKDNKLLIEIPTIQRDYAQGRKNKGEVRELFLQALCNYLEENVADRDLDFVYGSSENEDGVDKFIPLDGQQRITTLFLLHWYLALSSGNQKGFRELMLFENKSRFTYLTRPSSSEFVDALLLYEIDINNLLELPNEKNNRLSETIKNKGWYFLSWSYDPTIQSMLTMLDSIHSMFHNKPHFYDRLVNIEKPIITFQYLNLKEFSLTEDLYIKMNSRGKPLTAFENFKAKLEQHISILFNPNDKPYTISKSKIQASYQEYFAFQIDTSWANLFWQYKHLVGKPHTFDEELMNFIRVIIANQFAIEKPTELNAFRDIVNSESATAEISENISFHKFESIDAITKGSVVYLINAFEVLVNEDKPIKNYLQNQFYCNENELFEKALKYTLSLPERVLFHAYLRFLIKNRDDRRNLHEWIRVAHNLIENTRIEDPGQLISAINSIEKLLEHSKDILNHLATSNVRIEYFSPLQVEEEILKANLLIKSEEWKLIIEEYEQKGFHKGQLGYIFEFSGIMDYFNKHKKCDWKSAEDTVYIEKFKFYGFRSIKLFSNFDTKENKDFLLERSLLTKGNYLFPASTMRFNFGSSKSASNYQRDFSWKRLLRAEGDVVWAKRRGYVKELLDDQNFDPNNINNSLAIICEKEPDDWRMYFINNPELIKYCSQGFIYLDSKSEENYPEIELYSESQRNHYHINMYEYNFYVEYLKGYETEFLPFADTNWKAVKNSEDYSFALLEDWCFKRKYYNIEVKWIDGKFYVWFIKSKGNKNQDEYEKGIVEILLNYKFKWDKEENAYLIHRKSEITVKNLLVDICKKFNDLVNE